MSVLSPSGAHLTPLLRALRDLSRPRMNSPRSRMNSPRLRITHLPRGPGATLLGERGLHLAARSPLKRGPPPPDVLRNDAGATLCQCR
eukprot:1539931-Pyramimonas_sp.AAC.2